MGSTRMLLALAVVFTHSYGYVFVGGQLAVQLFYIISGFLISFVLVERNSYENFLKFYLNRFWRLFPIYWLVACITLILLGVGSILANENQFFNIYKNIDLTGKMLLIASNLFIFGQDWLMFTGIKDGSLQFVADLGESEINVWEGLLLNQTWTIGIELSFYLIAPFVLKREKVIFALLVASLIMRGYLIKIGIGFTDPWSYRFFPAELSLFLLGALSHQILKPCYIRFFSNKFSSISTVVTLFIIGYCVVFFLLPFKTFNTFFLIGVFILSLPMLFEFQNNFLWDRKIGDLSYPIYISHMTVLYLTPFILKHFDLGKSYFEINCALTILTTVILSYVIERKVSRYIESLRANNRNRITTS
jgi:peptidoglycan/LPS O-acetylase OafA/YrhL